MVGHIDIGHIDKTGLWVTLNGWGDVCSVNGGDEERLLSKLVPTFLNWI